MARPPRVTSAELAFRLGIDEETVANWRRGRSRPPLTALRRIVQEIARQRGVEGDTNFTVRSLLREMGVLEPDVAESDLVDRGLRLQKLELKLEEANATAAALGRRLGAGRVVQAAVESGRWAVAVWPAYEGPEGYEAIHVSDRIDITRVDGSDLSLTAEEVWRDPIMKAALRATRALRATASPRMAQYLNMPVSRWSISHVGSPRDPIAVSPWPGLNSLCFVSVSVQSWANDVAALVAFALGYGLTSTRDLALDIYGLAYGAAQDGARWSVHQQLLLDPPRRRVWSHSGPIDDFQRPYGLQPRSTVPGTLFVLVEEDDALLHMAAERRGVHASHLIAARENYRRWAEEVPEGRLIRLQAVKLDGRSARWDQALHHSLDVLDSLWGFGIMPAEEELSRIWQLSRRHEPAVIGPALGWLEAHGWPPRARRN